MRLEERLKAAFSGRGGAVGLVQDGEERDLVACGTADWGGARPLRDDASFYLYSLTKTYLAAIALRLHERGLLQLDAPVTQYLGELPFAQAFTTRQLLHNVSGVPDYGNAQTYGDALKASPSKAWDDARYLAEAAKVGLRFAPGTKWEYSNTGYMLVRRVLEHCGGARFSALLAREIAGPLGLMRTHVVEGLCDAADVTAGFGALPYKDSAICDVRPLYDPGWVAHGLVAAPIIDVANFYRALFAGRLFGRAGLNALTTLVQVPAAFPPFVDPSYGLGLIADPAFPGGAVYGHSGSGPGYQLQALHWPDFKGRPLTLIALANREDVDALKLCFALMPPAGPCA